MYRSLKNIDDSDISSWKSNGLKLPATSNNSLAPSASYTGTKTRVKFEDKCLKQEIITFNQGKTVNIYIVYEIDLRSKRDDDFFFYLGFLSWKFLSWTITGLQGKGEGIFNSSLPLHPLH